MVELIEHPLKALVTGASGKIGIELVSKLVELGFSVVALSSRNSFEKMQKVSFISHDWSQKFEYRLPDVDVIFHLASQTSAYVARQNISKDIETNLLNTVSILEAASRFRKAPIFIFAGSMTQYGIQASNPINESVPLAPITFYDTAKISSEIYIQQFARENMISKGISLRLANIYGNSKVDSDADRGFLDKSITKAIHGEEITVYGDGNYIRDYLHVTDAAEAFIKTFFNSWQLSDNVYNIGTGIGTSIIESLEMIVWKAHQLSGRRSRIVHVDFPEGAYSIEQRNSISDSSRFRNATEWLPKVKLMNGIEKTLENAWTSANYST
jgi:UDP-glucose 4-epimerase